ncbi:MAG: MFS transporter, partial [Planctomycetota bacterium]
VWGTVGWILAGITVGQWLLANHTPTGVGIEEIEDVQNAGRADAFRLSAILGLAMGLYCLTLPKTPPSKSADSASLKAIVEAKRQPLLTLFMIAVPISIIHQFYFVHAAGFLTEVQNRANNDSISGAINSVFGVGGGGLMTIGQMVEIAVIACMPLIATRVGRKWLLAVGIVAYALRMAIFAYLPDGGAALPLAITGVALHGFCFGCFIFVAFMVVDEQTTPDVRASAQNLFNLVIVGIGIIVGSMFATKIAEMNLYIDTDGIERMDYTGLFAVPMWMSFACLAALLVLYPARAKIVELATERPPSGDET